MQTTNLFDRIPMVAGKTLAQLKNRTAVMIAATLVVGGCVSSPPTHQMTQTSHQHYRLLPADMDAVKNGVMADMKDPSSAMFGAMAATVDSKNVVTVCGVVNGRNSYGGYVGKRPFTGVLGTNKYGERKFVTVGIGGTEIESQSIMMVCRRSGLG